MTSSRAATRGMTFLADDPAEVAEVQRVCAGLHLNIGTLHTGTVPALLNAGRAANVLGHPVVFDQGTVSENENSYDRLRRCRQRFCFIS